MVDRRYHVASLLIGVVVRMGENNTKTIRVNANLIESGAKQLRFLFENGLVWTRPKITKAP